MGIAVGKGRPPRLVVMSAVILVILFFYVFALGSFLDIGISKLETRRTALTFFDTHVLSEFGDNIVIASGIVLLLALYFKGASKVLAPVLFGALTVFAGLQSILLLSLIVLISAPTVVLLVLLGKKPAGEGSNKPRDIILTISANYFAITVIVLSIVSVIISFAPFSPLLKVDDEIRDHDYIYQIFILLSASSVIILLLLLGCFPVKLLINKVIRRRSHDNTKSTLLATEAAVRQRSVVQRIVYLSIFVALAVILALLPHQPFVNKDGQQIGVDTTGYVNWIQELTESKDPAEFFYQAFVVLNNGDRPVSLILLFVAGEISNSDLAFTLEHLPVILGPILVLVVYFLTRELTADDTSALLASFLTAVSFHVLIGIFAGYYANWIALIFGYSAFLFLLRFLKTSAVLNLIPFSALMMLLLFSHLYTWTIITIVMAAYLVVMFVVRSKITVHNYQRKDILLLILVLTSIVAIDIGKTRVTSSASGIALDLQIAEEASGFDQFAESWENLDYLLHSHAGGLFNNVIIFSLAFYWLYKSNWREPSTILIMVFLSIGLLPVLFGSWLVQARVFYDIPFQIPAGIALALLMKKSGGLLSLSLCVWLVAMAISLVLNFYSAPL